MGDRPEKCLKMSGVVDNCCRGCFKSPVRVGVYCCSEGTKLLIKLVLEVLHGLNEEFFGDKRAGIGGDIHCLDFARDYFSNGRMCEADCRVVGVRAIYAPSVWYEIYAPPKYVR